MNDAAGARRSPAAVRPAPPPSVSRAGSKTRGGAAAAAASTAIPTDEVHREEGEPATSRSTLHADAPGGGGRGDGAARLRRRARRGDRPFRAERQPSRRSWQEPTRRPPSRRGGGPVESASKQPRQRPRGSRRARPVPAALRRAGRRRTGRGSAEPNRRPNCRPEPILPPVSHVFVIVLGEQGYEESFGAASPAPYLSQDPAREGRAAVQLLRRRPGRPRQRNRAAQRPGPDPADRGQLPRIHRHRAGDDRPSGDRTGRRERLRLPGGDR